MSRALLLGLLLAGLVAFAACGESEKGEEALVVALLPDESADEVIRNNEGLRKYLEEKIGRKVELHVSTDYTTMIEAARSKKIDVAYFGPVSYTDAAAVADLEVFAAKTKNGQTTYRSLLIGNVAAGVTDLAKVRGKSVAWGDPKSTSSHLVPKLMLKQAGLSRNGDFKESFVGSHDQVAFTVEAGNNAQAGGLSQEIFESLVEEGKIDASKVKILKVSDPIPQYPWVMQAGLAPELKAKIREAFLSCTDKKIMKPLKAQGFAAIGDDAYGIIRELKSTLGNEADPRQ